MKWPVGRAQIRPGRLATSAVRGPLRPELPIGPADRRSRGATYPLSGSKTAFERPTLRRPRHLHVHGQRHRLAIRLDDFARVALAMAGRRLSTSAIGRCSAAQPRGSRSTSSVTTLRCRAERP
jgi:hypothetical protein